LDFFVFWLNLLCLGWPRLHVVARQQWLNQIPNMFVCGTAHARGGNPAAGKAAVGEKFMIASQVSPPDRMETIGLTMFPRKPYENHG